MSLSPSVLFCNVDWWGQVRWCCSAAVCSAGEFYSDLSNNCLYTEWSQPPLHPSSHQPVILHQHHPPTQWQYRFLMIPGKLSMYFFWQSSPPRWDLTIFVMFVLFPGMFSLQLPSLTAEQWRLIWILYWYSTNRRTMVQQQQQSIQTTKCKKHLGEEPEIQQQCPFMLSRATTRLGLEWIQSWRYNCGAAYFIVKTFQRS